MNPTWPASGPAWPRRRRVRMRGGIVVTLMRWSRSRSRGRADPAGQQGVDDDEDEDDQEHGPGHRGRAAEVEVVPALVVEVEAEGLVLVVDTADVPADAAEQQRLPEQLGRGDGDLRGPLAALPVDAVGPDVAERPIDEAVVASEQLGEDDRGGRG